MKGAASGLVLVHRQGGGCAAHTPHETRSKMRAARLKDHSYILFIDVVSLAQILVLIGLQEYKDQSLSTQHQRQTLMKS